MIPFHKFARGAWLATLALSATLGLSACSPNDNLVDPTQANPPDFAPIAAAANASLAVLTTTGQLLLTNAPGPGAEVRPPATVTGVIADHTLMAIDYRTNGELWGISMDLGAGDLQLYTIVVDTVANPVTATATPVGTEHVAVVDPLATAIGFDFNPSADLIRVVTDTEENLRFNPVGGTLAGTDTDLSPVGSIAAAAYTNSHPGVAGTGNTTLYVIDSGSDSLLRQGDVDGTPGSPNAGVLTSVGALGVGVSENVGFDIDGFSGTGYMGAGASIYRVSLSSGAATLVGTVADGSLTVRDVAATGPTSALGYGVRGTGGTLELVTFSLNAASTATLLAPLTNNHDRDADVKGVAFTDPATGAAAPTAPVAFSAGTTVLGIDFRPNPTVGTSTLAQGQLFALIQDGANTCLYTVGLVESAATAWVDVGIATPFDLYTFDKYDVASEGVQCAIDTLVHVDDDDDPDTDSKNDDDVPGTPDTKVNLGVAVTGVDFGFDFNPVADRVRAVSDVGESLRLNQTSGLVIDFLPPPASGADPNPGVQQDAATGRALVASAYTNSYPQQFRTALAPTASTLFVIDPTNDVLARQGAAPGTTGTCPGDVGNPNCGVTTDIGAGLGFDFGVDTSFDIVGGTQAGPAGTNYVNAIGYAVSGNTLYRVNLLTGVATSVGAITTTDPIIASTVQLKR